MASSAQQLSNAQPFLLDKLRPLERKMGLVLTLFKGQFNLIRRVISLIFRFVVFSSRVASMWAVLVQREEQQEEEDQRR